MPSTRARNQLYPDRREDCEETKLHVDWFATLFGIHSPMKKGGKLCARGAMYLRADTADANKRQNNKPNLPCFGIRINNISSYVTCTACTTLGNNFEIRCHGRNVRSQKPEIWRYGFALCNLKLVNGMRCVSMSVTAMQLKLGHDKSNMKSRIPRCPARYL